MGLREELAVKIPPHLMPGNVGTAAEVNWIYTFPVSFDLGAAFTVDPNTSVTAYFQVPQEAAFILKEISWTVDDYTDGTLPLQIQIRDRQSSRFFQNTPIPIQNIGPRAWPTKLSTSLIFMPTAFVDVTLSSWIPNAMVTAGVGKFHFSFSGVRIRVKSASEVLGTVFG